MARINVFSGSVVQGLSDVLGHASEGLTHKEITRKFSELNIEEKSGSNKVDRIYYALMNRQNLDGCGNMVIAFLNSVMEPASYTQNTGIFDTRKDKLNSVLGFAAFEVEDSGKIHHATKIDTFKEAATREKRRRDNIAEPMADKSSQIEEALNDFKNLANMQDEKKRGYAFEGFLNRLFSVHGLEPRNPFKLVGEQIDGSIDLDSQTYLIEARWRAAQANNGDLLVLKGKAEGKATWSRGIFISYSGFSKEGLEAFQDGKATNLICVCGQDLFLVLENRLCLKEILRQKTRKAAEEGLAYVPVFELARHIA